ncbi:MAG: hypothetical protein HS108_00855 [Planctomycetes bacterium]|jgi:hypothetical protein|nr:hypothetical protein [Planctomycetota bacterium]MCL4729117.1 hypothetical protein [Planctomycetota bacterium]
MRHLLISSALLVLFAISTNTDAVGAQNNNDDVARDIEDRLLLRDYGSGRKTVDTYFGRIHESPQAGQFAAYQNAKGERFSWCIASLRGNVCVIEQRLAGSNVVIAREVEFTGPLARRVRRAWVGKAGEKPVPATISDPPSNAVGLSGGMHYRDTTSELPDYEHAGRKWQAKLHVRKYWPTEADEGQPPHSIQRVWTSVENWFREDLRVETETAGTIAIVHDMVSVGDSSEPMLDWSDVPALTEAEDRALHDKLVQELETADLRQAISGGLTVAAHVGLHPDAKVGDWASYGFRRLTVVKLEQGRIVIECFAQRERNRVVEAVEFEFTDGKLGALMARHVGIVGTQPQLGVMPYVPQGAITELSRSEMATVEVAGRKWQATTITRSEIHNRRETLVETLEAQDQPFGQPLVETRTNKADKARSDRVELKELGSDAKPQLDWSAWKPGWGWRAPFSAEQAKAFVKVGMTWRYSQVITLDEGGTIQQDQHWTVTAADEVGYSVQCIRTAEGVRDELTTKLTWRTYLDRIAMLPVGKVRQETMKLGEREIRVVIYESSKRGSELPVVFGLSPDLPGIRIITEEELHGYSKIKLTEFNIPPKD